MDESISVRLPKEELKEVDNILEYENATKSAVLREILKLGIKKKMLEIALDKFQKNEATAWKAATIADIPLTEFLDTLKERGIEFHYGLEELNEDIKDLI
jgi:predicted HTH domain antitoxin